MRWGLFLKLKILNVKSFLRRAFVQTRNRDPKHPVQDLAWKTAHPKEIPTLMHPKPSPGA